MKFIIRKIFVDSINTTSLTENDSLLESANGVSQYGSLTNAMQLKNKSNSRKDNNYIALSEFFNRYDSVRNIALPLAAAASFFSISHFPLEKASSVSLLKLIGSLIDSYGLHIKWVWPFIFSGLITHDLIAFFAQPENRYGNTLADIFWGTSKNQLTWSTHLGKDIPDSILYALAPAAIIVAPAVTSVLMVLYKKFFWNPEQLRFKHFYKDDNSLKYQFRLHGESLPFIGKLTQAEFEIIWSQILNIEDRKGLFNELNLLAEHSAYYPQLRALTSLANIANNISQQRLEETAIESRNKDISELAVLSDRALITLKQAADFKKTDIEANAEKKQLYLKDMIAGLYANYLLWTLGEKPKKSLTQIYWLTWLYTPYVLYSNIRFAELSLRKFSDKVKFEQARTECEASNKRWDYFDESGNYDCTVCGDWQDIPLVEAKTSQDCLSALLRAPRTSQQLLERLPRILAVKDRNITEVDLSQLLSLSSSEWDSAISLLEQANLNQLVLLKVSRAIAKPIPEDKAKLSSLNRFLNKIQLATFDVSKLNIGPDNIKIILPGLKNAKPRHIIASETALQDEGIEYLFDALPDIQPEVLILADNYFGRLGDEKIAGYLSNNTLDTLVISGNLESEGIQSLAQRFSHLRKLDISRRPLSVTAVTAIGRGFRNSTLEEIILNDTDFDDAKIFMIAPDLKNAKSLKKITLANNYITNSGAGKLFDDLRNSTVTEVYISNNLFTEPGLASIQKNLPQTQVTLLDISRIRANSKAFNNFIEDLVYTKVITLIADNNHLADEIIPGLIKVYQDPRAVLRNISLAGNQLTSSGVNNFFYSAKPNNMTSINLSNNLLDLTFAESIPLILNKQSNLEVLILSNNLLGEPVAYALAATIPSSRLKILETAHCFLSNEGNKAIASTLIKPLPNQKDYASSSISLDEARALQDAQSYTQLIGLDVRGTGISDDAARVYCRFQPYTNIPFSRLRLEENPVSSQLVNISTCRISPANKSSNRGYNYSMNIMGNSLSLLALVYPVICLLLLFHSIYTAVSSITKGLKHRFFKLPLNNNEHAKKQESIQQESSTYALSLQK